MLKRFGVVFEYSMAWLLPIAGLSFVIAWLKFRKLSKLPDISKGMALLISGLRFIVIFTLLALLLNPAFSWVEKTKEKPLLVLAQDNSASLIKTKDSLYYRNEYKASLEKMSKALKSKFDIVPLTFGASIRQNDEYDFSEQYTNISAVFDYTDQHFIVRRPAAMILFSDGIYNTGVNPKYKTPDFPVYTVALGDTVAYPDVYIRNVETDKFNFVNTIFPIKVEVGAIKQKGSQVKCSLKQNDQVIARQILTIGQDYFFQEVSFEVEAPKKGIFRYSVELENDRVERTYENNRIETWMNIIDNSAKVAIYTTAPHPDIAAIKNAVGVSGIYRCKLYRWEEPLDSLNANLVILHNPDPHSTGYQQLMQEINRRKLRSVFADSEKTAKLNSITHPAIIGECKKRIAGARGIIFLVVPLLFETGMDEMCNATVVVVADKKARIKRLLDRDNIDEETAENMMKRQCEDAERIKKANYVIENDGDISDLKKKTLSLLAEIRTIAG